MNNFTHMQKVADISALKSLNDTPYFLIQAMIGSEVNNDGCLETPVLDALQIKNQVLDFVVDVPVIDGPCTIWSAFYRRYECVSIDIDGSVFAEW